MSCAAYIKMIPLPTAEEAKQRAGLRGTLSGWGWDRDGNVGGQQVLKVRA